MASAACAADERTVGSGGSKAKARGDRSMNITGIKLDAEQGQFIAHIESEHLSRDPKNLSRTSGLEPKLSSENRSRTDWKDYKRL